MALDDYLGLMGGAANIGGVPEAVQNALLGQQQIQGNAMQLQQAQQQMQEQQQFQRQFSQAMQNPTPQAIGQVIAANPRFAKEAQAGWSVYGDQAKKAKMSALADFRGYLEAGDVDGARKVLSQHKAADQAAGFDVSGYDSLSQLLDNGQTNTALGVGTYMLATADPDKFAENLKALNPPDRNGPDQKQYDYDLKLYGKEYADQAKFIRDSKVVSSPTGVYTMSPGTPSNPEGGDPSTGAAVDPPTILKGAAERGTITEQEAATVRSSLGANGDAKFRAWLAKNKIAVVPSTGGATKVVGGKTYRNVNGQWFEESE